MLCAVTWFRLIEPANQFGAPVQKANRVVDAELQPVEALGIAAEIVRRLHVVPVGVAVAVPDAAELFDGAVLAFSHSRNLAWVASQ